MCELAASAGKNPVVLAIMRYSYWKLYMCILISEFFKNCL